MLALFCALFASLLVTPGAQADDGATEVAAGTTARTQTPPDLASARLHFGRAAAGTDERSAAEALYFLGELDDLAFHFDAALARYEASATRLPSSRYAPRASNRARDLRAHAEGNFAPLVRLETIRRSPALANDAASIDALVRDAADFPAGRVRVEARMLAAEAYLGRLRRRDDAIPLLKLVIDDPHAELLTARAAASELVRTYEAKHDLPHALEITQRYPKLLEPNAERTIVRLIRRRPLRIVAIADLVLLGLLTMFALAGPRRKQVLRATRDVAPMALTFAALACGAAGLLASRYEQTSPYPFGAMLPAMFAVALLARGASAAGSPAPPARAVRGLAGFAGVFAAAFLMLDRMDPVYLQGFGL